MTDSDPSTHEFQLKRRTLFAAATAFAAAGVIASSTASSVAAQEATPAATPEAELPVIPPEITDFANDWPLSTGDLAATRVAKNSLIDSSNVSTLTPVWTVEAGAPTAFGAITSNPVVVGDTVYLIDNLASVWSVDRETGAINWRNDYNVSTAGPNGVAVGYGYLVAVLGDTATVVTLDAETGEEIWRYQLANHAAVGITMAPFIYDGRIYVSTEPGGNTKGTYQGGANGILFCLDLKTGITQWQWDTTQNLWNNWNVNSGGGLWYPPTVDENGVLYVAIGNAAPFPGTPEFPNASSRPGPNDYANCTVAIDTKAGGVKWSVNIKPHDLFDLDNQQTPVLGTVEIGGIETNVVYSSGKHGYIVASERESGYELWRTAVGLHMNDNLLELPDDEFVTVYPGTLGGVESPIAFKDGIVYVVTWNYPGAYSSKEFQFAGTPLNEATGQVIAIDGATGDILWDTTYRTGLAGCGPTIANDLLFTGGLDGIVRAISLADGSLVWSWQAPNGINTSFAIAGDLLIVPSGGPYIPSPDTAEPAAGTSAVWTALKLGA